jgi:HlyD family secretion protein
MRTRLLAAVAIVTILVAGVFFARGGAASPEIITAPVSRGDIVEVVAATGTLEAVTTVQVGSQISGTIEALYADFNSLVRKGEVLARIEPSSYQSQVDQAQANLDRAIADAQRLVVNVDDMTAQLARARELSSRSLIPATDLEAAEVGLRSAQAQKQSADAQVSQARASLNQARVTLEKTVITAPIDGFVIARNVDVGQTVAASLQAPTLFVIAADLTKMRVNASIDESDVGRIMAGQPVTFHVDAYPTEVFTGTVAQVRLSPIIIQNVVTYAGVIDVPNSQLKLKPGMTATVDIETARRDNVLRVPSSALGFTPTDEMWTALGQTNPSPSPAVSGRRQSTGSGRLWIDEHGSLAGRDVKTGFSNGTFTELLTSDLPEGSAVVTNVSLPVAKTGAASTTNPLLQMTPGGGRGFGSGGAGRAGGGGTGR